MESLKVRTKISNVIQKCHEMGWTCIKVNLSNIPIENDNFWDHLDDERGEKK